MMHFIIKFYIDLVLNSLRPQDGYFVHFLHFLTILHYLHVLCMFYYFEFALFYNPYFKKLGHYAKRKYNRMPLLTYLQLKTALRQYTFDLITFIDFVNICLFRI